MPKKILLADDSITIQKVVELTFSEGDYQVFAVGNGTQALRKVQEVRPDIALLDVIMPEASGYEVCEKLKKDPDTSRIPVLLLTGTFEPFDRRRAEAVGADGHLTKPFESQVLISRVEELIAAALPVMHDDVAARPAEATGADSESETKQTRAAPEAEEEVIFESFVPDRYDDLQDLANAESRPSFATEERPGSTVPAPAMPAIAEAAVTGTWDELASGLSSAPAGNGPDEAVTEQPSFPPGGISVPITQVFSQTEPVRETAPQAAPGAAPGEAGNGLRISAEQLDQIASQVVERLTDRVVRDIAWEIIPELAETLIRQRIRELEEKITREG